MVHGLYRPWMAKPRTTIIENNYINVDRGAHHHCGGGNGLLWGIFGLQALNSVLGGLFARPGMSSYNMGMYGGMYNSPMMYCGFGGGGGTYPAIGTAGTPQTTPQDTSLTNLTKIATDMGCKVIQNDDGTYTAYRTGEDGGEIKTGTYEEVRDAILGTTKPSDRATSDAEELAEIKRLSQELQEKSDQIEDLQSEIDALKEQGSSQTTTTTTTTTPATGADKGSETPAGASDSDIPEAAWERVDANTTAFGYKTSESLGGEDYKDCKTADAVLQHHLNIVGGKYNTPMDPQQLVAQIIKMNPSVFNSDGTVKENADWSKLDLPNKEWLVANSYLSENTKSNATSSTNSQNTKYDISPDPIIGGWSGII